MASENETTFADNVPVLYAIQLADVGDRFDLDGRGDYTVASRVFSATEHSYIHDIKNIQTNLFLLRGDNSRVLSTVAGATSRHFMRIGDSVLTPNGTFNVYYKYMGYREHNGLYHTMDNLQASTSYRESSIEAESNNLTAEAPTHPTLENSTNFRPTPWPWLYMSEVMKLCRPGVSFGLNTRVQQKIFIARDNEWDLKVNAGAEFNLLNQAPQNMAPYAASGDILVLSGLSYKVKGKVFKLNPLTLLYSVALVYSQL